MVLLCATERPAGATGLSRRWEEKVTTGGTGVEVHAPLATVCLS